MAFENLIDLTRLSYFLDKIKGLIPSTYAGSPSAGGPATVTNGIHYAQVDSTSTATVYTATVPGVTEYYDGLTILLKNGVVTSKANFTININGLGAKGAYSNLAAAGRESTIFSADYTMMFVYDSTRVSGGCWICYRGSDANTNTIGYQIRTNSSSLPMDSIVYRYRLLFTSANGKKFVPANNTTSTNATAVRAVCQSKIDPFGAIVYYGTTASVAADARPSTSYLWQQYGFTLGYSFNTAGGDLTLTPWSPVYIKCTPQDDGSAIIDSTTPYVQELPTTADGKIYIFLGVAYSATNVELMLDHPVYCHNGDHVCLWTGVVPKVYESKTAVSGGTDVSLVTTGEKYTWNHGMKVLDYGASTWSEFLSAYNDNKIVYCKVANRLSVMSYVKPKLVNHFNSETITTDTLILANGAEKASTGWCCSDYISVAVGDNYVLSGSTNYPWDGSSVVARIHGYSNGSWSQQVAYEALITPTNYSIEFTIPEGVNSIRISIPNSTNVIVGSYGTEPDFVEFQYYESVDPNAASQQSDTVSIYKLASDGTWTTVTRDIYRELPSGGSAGQVLKKSSATDYAVEWDDAGGALMIVTVSYNNGYHVDKTFAEIKSAIEDGITVIAHYPQTSNQSGTWGTWFMLKSYDSSNIRFNNISVSYYNTTESIIRVYITSGSSDTYCSYTSSTMVTSSVPSYTRGTPYIKVTYDSENDTYQVEGDGHDISEIIEADINGHGTAILRYQKKDLFNENYDTSDGDYEEYRLMRAYTTHTGGSDSGEEDPEWPVFTGYLIFSCACIENGIIKLKTFSISEQLYNWDNYENATVSYSEASLGAPPAATGVSF